MRRAGHTLLPHYKTIFTDTSSFIPAYSIPSSITRVQDSHNSINCGHQVHKKLNTAVTSPTGRSCSSFHHRHLERFTVQLHHSRLELITSYIFDIKSNPTAAMAVKLLLLVTLASLAFCVAFAARDLTETQSIPSSIAVPEDSHHHQCQLHQAVHARGYQHYRYNGTSWVQFNATARLYDTESNKQVGRHFFLPELDRQGGQATWESLPSKTNAGVSFSTVTCKSVSTVTVDADSIPWVLLETTQASGSKQFFGEVAFVQRVETKMGLAPKSSKSDCVGDVKKSPYTADYLFYVSETQQH